MVNCLGYQCPFVLQAHQFVFVSIVVGTLLHWERLCHFDTILAPLHDPMPSPLIGGSQSSNIACSKSSKEIPIECVSLLVYTVKSLVRCVPQHIPFSNVTPNLSKQLFHPSWLCSTSLFVVCWKIKEVISSPHKLVIPICAKYEVDGNCHYTSKTH